jgi:hypothetical protein
VGTDLGWFLWVGFRKRRGRECGVSWEMVYRGAQEKSFSPCSRVL